MQPNFVYRDPYGSIMKQILKVFDSPQPGEVHDIFPFSTSEKPALSALTKGMTLKRSDMVQLILWLQSHPPWKITPDLMNTFYELKKEMRVNWESAQNGKVLRIATGSIKVVEQSQKYSEDIPEAKGGGIIGRVFGRGRR
jgi:hypothetical protein